MSWHCFFSNNFQVKSELIVIDGSKNGNDTADCKENKTTVLNEEIGEYSATGELDYLINKYFVIKESSFCR